jgi:hypothetical protein
VSAMPYTRSDSLRTPWTRPDPATRAVLEAGWRHVQSVPYKVSTRWLFYRLLQDGFYHDKKKDYKDRFLKTFARARHTEWAGWRPDSLIDDRRDYETRSGGAEDETEATAIMKALVRRATNVPFDHLYRQTYYVALFYEAHAMSSQFQHYTRDLDLFPMGGDPSIPYKFRVAKRLEEAFEEYGKPIRICYFGDEDKAGHKIQSTVELDLRRWCRAPFDIVWCGLTMDQVQRYGVPTNFEKPGYQWEALRDEDAREIITSALAQHLDLSLIEDADQDAEAFTARWKDRFETFVNEVEKER